MATSSPETPTTTMPAGQAQQLRMSYEKYLAWAAEDVHSEWVNGVDFYVLDKQGRYQPVPVDSDGRYHSTVLPGLWLQVDWLMAAEPPAVFQALARIVGPQKLLEAMDDTLNR